MGMFDDLIPQQGSGMFADLIPTPEQRRARNEIAVDTAATGLVPRSSLAQAIPVIGPYLDEAAAAVTAIPNIMTGGAVGPSYNLALERLRAKDEAARAARPIEQPILDVAAGVATGGHLFSKLPIARTLPGQMTQGVAIGAPVGFAEGFGRGEGSLEDRLETARTGAGMGAAFGAALPPAIRAGGWAGEKVVDAASPVLARYGQELRNRIGASPEPRPQSAGAAASDGGAAPPVTGAEAAAEQIIANQLARANLSTTDLRQRLAEVREAARFHTSGRAQVATAPVDLDPSLQRLAGTIARQQPEVANIGQGFLTARQTGSPARGQSPRDVAKQGLPARPSLSQPMTGAQAERELGSRFGTPEQSIVPMGQAERVRDALKRALLIRDEGFHKHGKTAYRTENAVIEEAREEAEALYGATYSAGQNINIAPQIAPVVERWTARSLEEPGPVAAAIKGALRLFNTKTGPVTNIERFDKAKQFLDGKIEKLFESVEGRNRYLGGVLTEMKNDLLSSVDGIKTQNLGEAYRAARSAFGSRMEARDAIRLGRDAWKEDSEIVADMFAALPDGPMRKLARLGYLEGYERAASRMGRSHDVTRLFDNPRQQEILRVIIPRTETATGRSKLGAEFSNRPERMGKYLDNEREMIATRNVAFGGSQTQRNIQDDKATDSISTMVDQLRQQPSLVGISMKVVERALDKLFGFRPDTAREIARRLFTAQQSEIDRLMIALDRRLGPNRAAQLAKFLEEYQRILGQSGGSASAVAAEGN